MSATKLLAYVGGAGALGYGAYFAVQQREVSKYEKEVSELAKLVQKETTKIATTQATIKEQEQKVQKLTAQEDTVKTQLKKAQEKLEAAQKEVSKLDTELSKAVSERTSVLQRLVSLKQDSERVKEALTLGEKSLVIAKTRAAESKALLNPLNHPLIAGKMGGKK